MKSVIAAHDLSGWGRCSLSVALPALASSGLRVASLPTAYLSTHTGHPDFTFLDLTEEMKKTLAHWKELGLRFDALYSGFLGSAEQIEVVMSAKELLKPYGLMIIDPVMGDDGVTYKTYTPEMCVRMRDLAKIADVLTPNVTEAAILLGRDYSSAPKEPEGFTAWLEELSRGGECSVIITGITPSPCTIGQVFYNRDTGNSGYVGRGFAGIRYHGTGDLFTSLFCASYLNGKPFAECAEFAADTVRSACAEAWENGAPAEDGVPFEKYL